MPHWGIGLAGFAIGRSRPVAQRADRRPARRVQRQLGAEQRRRGDDRAPGPCGCCGWWARSTPPDRNHRPLAGENRVQNATARLVERWCSAEPVPSWRGKVENRLVIEVGALTRVSVVEDRPYAEGASDKMLTVDITCRKRSIGEINRNLVSGFALQWTRRPSGGLGCDCRCSRRRSTKYGLVS